MIVIEKELFKGRPKSIVGSIVNHRYIDCQFENCKLSNLSFINCEFYNCIFRNCDFSGTFLALNINYESGKFVECIFITCNLSKTSFRFPIVDKSEFRNCILYETNFDGSRFSDTSFIGELDSCFFRGYSKFAAKNSLFYFKRFDVSKFPNKMINVNFSLSKMIGVSFSNGIDLSQCIFPEGDRYVFIKNLRETVMKANLIIEKQWKEGYEKRTAIKLLDAIYYNDDLKNQQSNFVDSFFIEEISKDENDEGVGMKLFELIKDLQKK